MNTDEIRNAIAGPEIDLLFAEVVGLPLKPNDDSDDPPQPFIFCNVIRNGKLVGLGVHQENTSDSWQPSTNVGQALEWAERWCEKNNRNLFIEWNPSCSGHKPYASIGPYIGRGKTIALAVVCAVCLAAKEETS